MNFDDLNMEKSYTPWKAYCQSKLANVLFSKELARMLQGRLLCPFSPILSPFFILKKNLHEFLHASNTHKGSLASSSVIISFFSYFARR
jgi:hypothetical protein